MNQENEHESFMVWASDHMVYGPVQLPTLLEWVKEGRVFPKTWVLSQKQNRWCHAEMIEQLREFFKPGSVAASANSLSNSAVGVRPEELRPFSAFASLSNQLLEQFIQFGELVSAPPGRVLIRRNDPSDSLYFILSGEVRARLMIGFEDKTLGRMAAGECFGEVAMFTGNARSADVVIQSDARMLRFTSEACLLLINQLPQVAAPILFGMARMMASRLTERTQQFQQEVAAGFLWR